MRWRKRSISFRSSSSDRRGLIVTKVFPLYLVISSSKDAAPALRQADPDERLRGADGRKRAEIRATMSRYRAPVALGIIPLSRTGTFSIARR